MCVYYIFSKIIIELLIKRIKIIRGNYLIVDKKSRLHSTNEY